MGNTFCPQEPKSNIYLLHSFITLLSRSLFPCNLVILLVGASIQVNITYGDPGGLNWDYLIPKIFKKPKIVQDPSFWHKLNIYSADHNCYYLHLLGNLNFQVCLYFVLFIYFINETSYFKIIVDSDTVLRNSTNIQCTFTQFPLMVTSQNTTVQYSNQTIDTDTFRYRISPSPQESLCCLL